MPKKTKKIIEKSELTNLQGLPKVKYTSPSVKLIALIDDTQGKDYTTVGEPNNNGFNVYGPS